MLHFVSSALFLVAANILGCAQQTVPLVSSEKKPTKIVNPTYPESAKRSGLHGSVVLDLTIGKAGNVEAALAISGPTELWSAALEAVKQ